ARGLLEQRPCDRRFQRQALGVAVVLERARTRIDHSRLVLVGAMGRDVRREVVVENGTHSGERWASYMPNSSRSTFHISPILQRARRASRIGGGRFAPPPRVPRARSAAPGDPL